MISPERFHHALEECGVEFFSGVPDSLLKEFCAYVDAVLPSSRHLIAANEGAAVALAAGYHLATGSLPLVYLQNSGLGNAVNPLLSLADSEVYGLPMIVLIGWRGEPGVKDEPQHVKQGRVTPAMLTAMGIAHWIMESDEARALASVREAAQAALRLNTPVALLVRQDAFAKSSERRPHPHAGRYGLSRERAIESLIDALPPSATLVSTTGKISRELYELRRKKGQSPARDFLTVGSMGHASQIALGIAIAMPENLIVCVDGDGAALMHLGGFASIGTVAPRRFLHVVLNNGAHESVGGQPTAAFDVSLSGIAKAAGYARVASPIDTQEAIAGAVAGLIADTGPALLEIRISTASRADLGRPAETPAQNKALFVERLKGL